MRRLTALLFTLLISGAPARAAVRAVNPVPPRVQTPLTALGGMLGQSFHLTSPALPQTRLEQLQQPNLGLPAAAAGVAAAGPAAASRPAPQAAAVQQTLQNPVSAADLMPKSKARAVQERILQIEAKAEAKKGRTQESTPLYDPKKGEDPLGERGETALGILQKVNAVFEDFSEAEIKAMPEEDLAALVGAVIEQSGQKKNSEVLPGYHAARILAERKNAVLLGLRGKPAETTVTRQGQKIDSFNHISNEGVPATIAPVEEPLVYRHYTTRDGWRRMVETATLKNGVVPYVIYGGADKESFSKMTGAFLTVPQRDPTNVGVPRDNGYFVDLQVPAGIPVLQIEKDNIYLIPLPGSTHGWVKAYFDKFLAGQTLESYYQRMVEAMAKFGGPGPDIHVPIKIVGAGAAKTRRSVSLDGLRLKGAALYNGDAKLEFVGAGAWGRVFVHPADDGAVVKVSFSGSLDAIVSGLSPERVHDADLRMSLRLAEAGAGPEVLASGKVAAAPGTLDKIMGLIRRRPAKDGQLPAIAKERVDGETVADLIAKRKFGPEEYQLVSAMLDKLAEAGIKPGDLRTSNIMIGTTKSGKTRRALVVDGGGFLPVAPDASAAALRQELAEMPVHAGFVHIGDGHPSEPILTPLDQLLRAGLKRYRRK